MLYLPSLPLVGGGLKGGGVRGTLRISYITSFTIGGFQQPFRMSPIVSFCCRNRFFHSRAGAKSRISGPETVSTVSGSGACAQMTSFRNRNDLNVPHTMGASLRHHAFYSLRIEPARFFFCHLGKVIHIDRMLFRIYLLWGSLLTATWATSNPD